MKQNILMGVFITLYSFFLFTSSGLAQPYTTTISIDVKNIENDQPLYLAKIFFGSYHLAYTTNGKGHFSTTLNTESDESLDLRVTYPGFITVTIPQAIVICEENNIECYMTPQSPTPDNTPAPPGTDPELDIIYGRPSLPGTRVSITGKVFNARNEKPVYNCRLILLDYPRQTQFQRNTAGQNQMMSRGEEDFLASRPLLYNDTSQVKFVRTAGSGVFRFEDLYPGDYTIAAWKPGFLPDTLYDVRVEHAKKTELIVRLFEDTTVVQVYGKTVEVGTGKTIDYTRIQLLEHDTTAIGNNGVFQFTHITPGKPYTLNIHHRWYKKKHLEEIIFSDNTTDTLIIELEHRPIQLVSNYTDSCVQEDVHAFDIVNTYVLSKEPGTTWIQGQVSDAADPEESVSACKVSLVGSDQAWHTSENGEFVFTNVSPGKYTLVFEYPGYIPLTLPLNLQNAEPIVLCKVRLQPED